MTQKTIIVGLTGGMGAGKSTLSAIARGRSIPILDMDAQVRALYGDEMICGFLTHEWSLDPNVSMKFQIKEMLLHHPDRLARLEEIFTPFLNFQVEQFISFYRGKVSLALIDAPLLFESKLDQKCDWTVGAICPEPIRRERVTERGTMSPQMIDQLMSRQLDPFQLRLRCNLHVDTSGSKEDSQNKFNEILDFLEEMTL